MQHKKWDLFSVPFLVLLLLVICTICDVFQVLSYVLVLFVYFVVICFEVFVEFEFAVLFSVHI